jgi:hypothetical protein
MTLDDKDYDDDNDFDNFLVPNPRRLGLKILNPKIMDSAQFYIQNY